MKEHEHATQNKPTTVPAHDDLTKKVTETKAPHAGPAHHAHMAADFRKRFWISLVLTVPILVLSPMLQSLVGLGEAISFSGDLYVLFGLSSAVFWYGGWPFLTGLCRGTQIPPARDDDAHLGRHRHGVSLQQRGCIRPDWQPVLLGAGLTHRHHAARALDRNEVRDGRVAGVGGAGQTHALRCPQAHARRQREGRAAERTGGG